MTWDEWLAINRTLFQLITPNNSLKRRNNSFILHLGTRSLCFLLYIVHISLLAWNVLKYIDIVMISEENDTVFFSCFFKLIELLLSNRKLKMAKIDPFTLHSCFRFSLSISIRSSSASVKWRRLPLWCTFPRPSQRNPIQHPKWRLRMSKYEQLPPRFDILVQIKMAIR